LVFTIDKAGTGKQFGEMGSGHWDCGYLGATPREYYKTTKISKFLDKNLSITQAFDAYNISDNGFTTEKVAFPPSVYRDVTGTHCV
jgi:hypothetical protein